ncbi:SMI1/KNR4 family protein [Kitasatospora sp. NPDC098652]|uniref:SMI1/KNR4 family protein n=1 Tax=Kitasatospora sp. NPDC098652 TaxID=3364095 RepID=UPI00381419FB
MTAADDRRFPCPLAAALAVPFDYGGGEGIDFEPFDAFLSAEDTTDWLRLWSGNDELTGDGFRVFGQDGTGGCAAFWLARPDRPLTDQPVVVLGSEGGTGVVAADLADFLWVLAAGTGPFEATVDNDPDRTPRPSPERTAVAERFAPQRRRPARAITEQAGQEYPHFDDIVLELCRC